MTLDAPQRDRTLDILRAIATVRVVIFHATGDVRWSWFAAMPVMFFVGGALYAQSLDRQPSRRVLFNRVKRIMIPTWAWSAFVFVVFTVADVWREVPWWGALGYVIPIASPTGPCPSTPCVTNGPLYWTWMHMWYISAYLLLMILGIPGRAAHKRWPRLTMAVLIVPVVVSGLMREPAIGALTFIIVFWVGGYAYHDHRDRLPGTIPALLVASASGLAAVVYAAAFTNFKIDLKAIPILYDLAGLAAVAAAIAARPWIRTWVRWRPVDQVVTWFQQRALTTYLWHALAVGITIEILGRESLSERPDALLLAMVFPLTFVVVTLVGWIEDLAAGRPPRLLPRLQHATVAGDPVDLRHVGVDLRERRDEVQDSAESPAKESKPT